MTILNENKIIISLIGEIKEIVKKHQNLSGEFSDVAKSLTADFVDLLSGECDDFPYPLGISFGGVRSYSTYEEEDDFIESLLEERNAWVRVYEDTGERKKSIDGIMFAFLNIIDGYWGGKRNLVSINTLNKNKELISINKDVKLNSLYVM